MSDFVFNGVSAESMGLRIERYPVIHKPRKRMTSIAVPGRNGDLHISDGSYESIVIRYECWWKNQSANFPTGRTAHEVAEWLYSAPVAARLEDTYDSLVFRAATFQGPMDVENILDRYGRVTLEFQCRPEAWLKSAEKPFPFTAAGGFLNNPTPFSSKPLIRVVTDGIRVGGSVYIGAKVLTLNWGDTARREIWVDCEEEEAWEIVDGQEVPCNAWIAGADYIQIQPGRNDVSFTASFESVTVYRRCYTL